MFNYINFSSIILTSQMQFFIPDDAHFKQQQIQLRMRKCFYSVCLARYRGNPVIARQKVSSY